MNDTVIPLLLSLVAAGISVAATWRILASVIGNLTTKLDQTIEQRNAADLGRIKEIEAQVMLKNDMADMGRQMLVQQNDMAKLTAKIVELQTGETARLETIRRLQDEREVDQGARDDLAREVKKLQNQNNELRNEFEKRIDALENQVDKLTTERDELIKERDDLKVRLVQAEKAESDLRQRVAVLEKASQSKSPDVIEHNPTLVLTAPESAIRPPEGGSQR